jgi:CRP-like cAMP-binding protein
LSEDPSTSNRLLAFLAPADRALLDPHLEAVDLPLRRFLEHRHREIEHIYFLDHGIASVVANANSAHPVEVGLIGWEGVTGLATIMATDQSPHDVYMQLAGAGRRLGVEAFRDAMAQSASLRQCLLNYAHVFSVQVAQTALANGRCKIEARLARWLLMAQDRIAGDELSLTHEFLAMMLGVRRPGVTVAINALESAGLIQNRRGAIVFIDRTGLEEAADGAYGVAETEMRRLFG